MMNDIIFGIDWPFLAIGALTIATIAISLTLLLLLIVLVRGALRYLHARRTTPIALRHAVVLLHGLFGFDQIGRWGLRQDYFRGIPRHLTRLQVDLYQPKVPLADSIEVRAMHLAHFVRGLGRPVIFLAHSMGGLDARYAIRRLGLAQHTACLVTIGTPHRGTPIATIGDWGPIRILRRLGARLSFSTAGVDALTEEAMQAFNDEERDDPGVDYFSVVSTAKWRTLLFSPLLWLSHLYLTRRSGENDGIVPTAAQTWGEVLFEIHADHWAQIGWSWRFDAPRLYERILREMQRRGY